VADLAEIEVMVAAALPRLDRLIDKIASAAGSALKCA